VTEGRHAPACQQVTPPMTNRTNFLTIPAPSASAKRAWTKETAEACRQRASADLLKAAAMITANQRLALERSAESWSLRAVLLDRVEATAAKTRSSEAEQVRL